MKKTFRTIVTAVLLVSVPAGARVAALVRCGLVDALLHSCAAEHR